MKTLVGGIAVLVLIWAVALLLMFLHDLGLL